MKMERMLWQKYQCHNNPSKSLEDPATKGNLPLFFRWEDSASSIRPIFTIYYFTIKKYLDVLKLCDVSKNFWPWLKVVKNNCLYYDCASIQCKSIWRNKGRSRRAIICAKVWPHGQVAFASHSHLDSRHFLNCKFKSCLFSYF